MCDHFNYCISDNYNVFIFGNRTWSEAVKFLSTWTQLISYVTFMYFTNSHEILWHCYSYKQELQIKNFCYICNENIFTEGQMESLDSLIRLGCDFKLLEETIQTFGFKNLKNE